MGAFLFFGDAQDVMAWDIIRQESQELTNTITDHPVETGVDITDHVRPNPIRVTLEGFISNTPVYSDSGVQDKIVLNPPTPPIPINLNGAIDAIGAGLGNLLFGPKQFTASVMTFPSYGDFVSQAMDTLDKIRTQAIICTVVCPSKTYDNMIIESITTNGDEGTGTGRDIAVELRQVRVVSSSITAAPKPTIPRAKPSQAKGDQGATVPDDQKESLLHNLLGGS